MTIFELLKHPIFNLSSVVQSTKYERIFIDVIDDYLDLLEKLEDFELEQPHKHKASAKKISNVAYQLSKGIINTLKTFYNGMPHEAFYDFKALLDNSNLIYNAERLYDGKDFYRARIANSNTHFTPNELFHIPFHLKNKIETQRYSILGFPSLYLSDSVYTCWTELDKPALKMMHIARFKLKAKPYQILQIPYPQEVIEKHVPIGKELGSVNPEITSLLMNFPLYLACSIGAKNPNDPFKVEYVIPQMLLQYVRQNKDIQGIKYFTTHINRENKEIKGTFNNYVFPILSASTEGYCVELGAMFDMTDPTLASSLLNPTNSLIREEESANVQQINGGVPYFTTEFGIIEHQLSLKTIKPLNFN